MSQLSLRPAKKNDDNEGFRQIMPNCN